MNLFLILAFLFFIGSLSGWVMELLFRRFISSMNPERKWINPGFCSGPYLPLYGCGLCLLYLIASLENIGLIENPFWNKILLFIIMAVCMTVLEYIAGVLSLKITNVRLWDYSNEWGNIQGIICPKFSFIWAVLGALYYFLIHPYILGALEWLSCNLAFSFFIGLFFGFFSIDVVKSIQLITKLRKFAAENNVILRFDTIKSRIRMRAEETKQKYYFFRPFRSENPLSEHLKELKESFEQKIKRR
jgi:uncharacterized membrane protein